MSLSLPLPSRARLAVALTACVVAALGIGSCSGEDDRPAAAPTTPVPQTVGPDSPLAYAAFSDPAAPIYVALGRRFALSLESQPAEGRRWQTTTPPDPAIVRSIGTEFEPAPEGATDAPAVQLLLFVAAGEGETTVTVSLVAADGTPVADQPPLTFTIVVSLSGEPPPPPPEDGTTTTSPHGDSGDEEDEDTGDE